MIAGKSGMEEEVVGVGYAAAAGGALAQSSSSS